MTGPVVTGPVVTGPVVTGPSVTGPSVVVAGGGIGGLALAVALRGAGIGVTVVERTARIAEAGSGMVLYPNAITALDAISPRLGRAVRAAGHEAVPGDTRPTLASDGTTLAVDAIGELTRRFGAPQVTLLRSALQHALLGEALAAGVDLRTGVRVDDHADRGEHVDVVLSDGSVLTADVLVGADGVRSGVRRRLFGDSPLLYRGYTSVRGRTRRSGAHPNGFIASGDGVDLFAGPIGGGHLYWAAKIVAPPGVWPAMGPAAAMPALLDLLAGWHDSIVEIIRDVDADGIVVTDIVDRDPIPRWTSGRVTLLGDAAHPMTPGVGQGAGMALEDAAVLAHHLRSCSDAPAALEAYSAARASRAADVVLRSRRTGRVDKESGAGEASGAPRDFSTQDEGPMTLFGWRPPGHVEPGRVEPDRVEAVPV
ncbi:FAD-dependent monooxygenase [Streptosporangium sandarakinum]